MEVISNEILAKTSLHPYFYFCFNLLMVACLLSFISIIVITCKNTKKSIELDMLDSTQQTILKQEDEMKLLQEQILEKQAYIILIFILRSIFVNLKSMKK